MEKIPFFSFISLSSAPKCFIYFCHLMSFLSDRVSALHVLFHGGDCTCRLFLTHGNIFSFTTWQHFWWLFFAVGFFLYLPSLLVVFLEMLNIKFKCTTKFKCIVHRKINIRMFIVIPSIRAKMSKSNVKNSKSMNSAFIQWNILYGNGNE